MSTDSPRPLFDPGLVAAALDLIVSANQVLELRILNGVIGSRDWAATLSGYFNDRDKLIEALKTVRSATGFYITVNPVNPALLARGCNRLRKAEKGSSTGDGDILSRNWLLIDTDAQRPAGISADENEHAAALERAREIANFLTELGWPEPIVADSGNGGHLMYRIDMPVEDDGLVKGCLEALAAQFNDGLVKVDTSVSNPARIWKLYGTRACKGDHLPERPHRLAQILKAPQSLEVVSGEQLANLTSGAPVDPAPDRHPLASHGSPFDIERFITENSLDVDGPHDWNGQQGSGRRWTLRTSPMCEHHDGAAFIIHHGSGAISAGCHHNSCNWNWAQLRGRLSPIDATLSKPLENRDSVVLSTNQIQAPRIALAPYQPFPVDVFPDPLRSFVVAAAEAIGCDPSYIALPTLACLARAIGNTRVIRLKASWTEPAIIWAAIVGKSGTHKSPALRIATQILQQKQRDELERHKQAVKEYEVQHAIYERDYSHWKSIRAKKSDEPPPWEPEMPQLARFIVGDITMEALAARLDGQHDGVLLVQDELSSWINGIGEYKGRKSSDNGHWLETWSASTMTIDRKTSGKPVIFIHRASVSLVGGIQPGILRTALGREHMMDGMCARLLLAMPEPRPVRWTEAVVPPQTLTQINAVYDRLLSLEATVDSNGSPAPIPIDLTPEAKKLWIANYNQHRAEQTGLDDDLSAAWSKLEAYKARIALIFQLCSWADGDASQDAIDEAALHAAVQLTDWFRGETRRVYAVLLENEEQSEIRTLVEFIKRNDGQVSERQLQRAMSKRFPTAAVAETALSKLAKAGYGTWENTPIGPKGGRPTRVFRLHDANDK